MAASLTHPQVRQIIAKRLLESKQTIPHLYVSADVELDGVSALREAVKQQGGKVCGWGRLGRCSARRVQLPVGAFSTVG